MEIMSVSALNTKIKSLLETTFSQIYVEGEVASATYHSSGHLYFSLKDEKSVVRSVMWRSSVARMPFRLEVGARVVVKGSVSAYVPRGDYQLQAHSIEPSGKGAQALAFEQLKKKLEQKGYFDPAIKKPIPRFPKTIALITAGNSAAYHDMVTIANRRWPLLKIELYDVLVQGEGAASQIIAALKRADMRAYDAVVIARGGGSYEDLQAFNDEGVADAIYGLKHFVISAIGHEIDWVISDFVADKRAPTPSAAMELLLPEIGELYQTLDIYANTLNAAMQKKLDSAQSQLLGLQATLGRYSPKLRLEQIANRLAQQKLELGYAFESLLAKRKQALMSSKQELEFAMQRGMQQKKHTLEHLALTLDRLKPGEKKKSGWAQVSKEGRSVDIESLESGDEITLSDGKVALRAKVVSKKSLW